MRFLLKVIVFCFFFVKLFSFEMKDFSNYEFDQSMIESMNAMKHFKQYTFGLEAPIDREKEKIDWILENKDAQVKEVIEGKIYLRPECLIHSDFGVFLRVENFIIVKLSNLSFDEKGYYIPLVN
jgi:hypothetical protein